MSKNIELQREIGNFDAHAGIYFRNVSESNPNGYGNNILRTELAKRGVGSLVVSGSDSFDFEKNTVQVLPTGADPEAPITLGDALTIPLDTTASGLSVVRARVLTPKALDERLPVLNGNRLRSLGASKWEQYTIAGDFMPRTVMLEDGQRYSDQIIESLRGDILVVKADMSQAGRHIKVVTRADVPAAVMGLREEFSLQEVKSKARSNNRILVQEYAPGRAMRGLVGTNPDATQELAAADATELRVYCFVDSDGRVSRDQRYYATARAFAPMEQGSTPTDEWAPVDQASVPESAWKVAEVLSGRILKATGVKGGYFAIDLIEVEGKDGISRMMVREINTRDPMMLVESEDKADARAQRARLANVMAVLAKNAPQTGPSKA